jgi:hypothetical protein
MNVKKQKTLLAYIRGLLEQNKKINYTPGDIRLGSGMYRTPEEVENFKAKQRKRRLP